jgi:DNA-binding Xre family transcriptional regulator
MISASVLGSAVGFDGTAGFDGAVGFSDWLCSVFSDVSVFVSGRESRLAGSVAVFDSFPNESNVEQLVIVKIKAVKTGNSAFVIKTPNFIIHTIQYIFTIYLCVLSTQKGSNNKHNMKEYVENEELLFQIKQIALRLRDLREKRHISQMELSLAAGLSQNQVNYIETGKRTPNLFTLLKLCNALEINPAVLFSPPEEERAKVKHTIINLLSRYL